jgi:hypothetical protein
MRARTLSLYVRKGCHGSVDLPHEVHVDDPGELFGSRLLESSEEPHRGEVHPGVEPPVLLYGAGGHGLHLLVLRGVGDHVRRLAALAPYLVHQGGEAFLAPGRDDHLRAPFGEPKGRLSADTAGCSHQHHYLLFHCLQPHIYRSLRCLLCLRVLLLASVFRPERSLVSLLRTRPTLTPLASDNAQ